MIKLEGLKPGWHRLNVFSHIIFPVSNGKNNIIVIKIYEENVLSILNGTVGMLVLMIS